MGENLKKNGYAKLNHFAVCVNLTQCCKSTRLFLGCAGSWLLRTGFL